MRFELWFAELCPSVVSLRLLVTTLCFDVSARSRHNLLCLLLDGQLGRHS